MIRNVALLGHSGSGKTTLVEALLLRAGVVARAGRVEDGTTVCDTDPEEVKRTMSLSLAVAPFEWSCHADGAAVGAAAARGPFKVNLLDTPGYADFAGEVDAALSVADLAVIVVSATDGVEVGTELAWAKCASIGLPRMVFVNKEDKPRADFRRVLDELRATFGQGFVPLELPLGEEDRFHGLADVLTEQGLEYEPGGRHRTEALPDDVVDEEHRLHDALVEEIVTGDDEQLERYLAGDVPSPAELERTLAQEMLDGVEYPVLVGSATAGIGVDRLADFICELGPSPLARPVTVVAGHDPLAAPDTAADVGAAADAAGGTSGVEVEVPADAAGRPLVHVFKTVADQFVGQVSLFKVLSGTVAVDDRLLNTATGVEERLHSLFHLRGKDHLPVDRIMAGDLAAVAKLTATATGSTLAPKDSPVRVRPLAPPPPSFGLALEPLTQSDDDKLSAALHRLTAEDPGLVVGRVEETGQTVLRGCGDTHLAVALERLARKFGVHVATDDVQVAYRETIIGSAGAEGRIKKQSGGHGQFAVAHLRVSPTSRGAGVEFVDSVVGGAIPRQYVPAVRRGVEEAMAAGGPLGFPVVDVRVECHDGRAHSVDSSEMAFRTAAANGVRAALRQAGPAVLEPVSRLDVTVPEGHQGDVLGDLNARRGRVTATTVREDGCHEIEALVPTAETARYAVELRSMTGGRGTFRAVHDHYELLPDHLAARLQAAAKIYDDH